MNDSAQLIPVDVTWTVTSSGDQPQAVPADPLVIQVAKIHLGLKGEKGNKGDKGDTPEVTLSTQAARDAAVQAAIDAQQFTEEATQKAAEAQQYAQAAAQSASEVDPSTILRRLLSGDPLPPQDVGPIWHDDYADIMTWRTIGSYTGYASVSLGAVEYFDATTPPPGWLESAGQTVSSAYEALIAFRGGATLRDLRGEFVRGWDHGRGVDSGRVFGSAQADEFKSHTHAANNQNTTVYLVPNGAFYGLIGNDLGATRPTGATGSTETRPRNVALLPCIKF